MTPAETPQAAAEKRVSVPPDALAQAVAEIRERLENARWGANPFAVGVAEEMGNIFRARSVFLRAVEADIHLLLQALAEAEARAARYRTQRDEALAIADDLDADLSSELDEDGDPRLAILRGLIDVADGSVREITSVADILAGDGEGE